MEISAMTGNSTTFDVLVPHCKDELKKKLARIVLLALRDKAPSEEFKTLFASIPLGEVTKSLIVASDVSYSHFKC